MRYLRIIIVCAILIIAGTANSDPGIGTFTNTKSGLNVSTVDVKFGGGTLIYSFTTAIDSVKFTVSSPRADLCFDSDRTSAVVGSARVAVWYAFDPSNPLTVSSINPQAVPVDTNCVSLINGSYWVEVTVASSGLEEPIVAVTGRSN